MKRIEWCGLELSASEMQQINGGSADEGSLVEQFAWFIGRTAQSIWEFSKQASEYQASMPSELKK